MHWVIIGSDNALLSDQHQAIIWTNAGILLIWPLGNNFSEIQIKIQNFSFMKMHFKMSSVKSAAILSRGRWVNVDSIYIYDNHFKGWYTSVVVRITAEQQLSDKNTLLSYFIEKTAGCVAYQVQCFLWTTIPSELPGRLWDADNVSSSYQLVLCC